MFDNRQGHFRRQKCDLERSRKILKYKDLPTAIQRMWHVQSESDTINNIGNWNHLQVIQKIPHQQTGKARNLELQKTATLGTAHTAGSVDVKVQNV
jgi:hypothetical protein